MNHGDVFDVPGPEFALVSDITADVLVRGDDGKLRNTFLALVTIFSVEPMGAAA